MCVGGGRGGGGGSQIASVEFLHIACQLKITVPVDGLAVLSILDKEVGRCTEQQIDSYAV